MVGGHYTYAEMPLFSWLRDAFDLGRNHYARVGHVAQGFVPAIVAREILLRNFCSAGFMTGSCGKSLRAAPANSLDRLD